MSENQNESLGGEPQTGRARILNISGVPFHIWQRARTNALVSDMPFRDYVIKLLEECRPIEHPKGME